MISFFFCEINFLEIKVRLAKLSPYKLILTFIPKKVRRIEVRTPRIPSGSKCCIVW